MPSVCLPHAVPSENRAHFTVKHTELENVKIIRYGKVLLHEELHMHDTCMAHAHTVLGLEA